MEILFGVQDLKKILKQSKEFKKEQQKWFNVLEIYRM